VPAFTNRDVPVTRACVLLGVSRRRLKYASKSTKKNSELVNRLMELTRQHPRWGCRQLRRSLRRRGEVVNLKRVRRLCRLHGLLLRQRRRKKRLGIGAGMIRLSIGLETTEDLLWDLDQALQATSA